MNNSKIAIENISISLDQINNSAKLRERESLLVRIIEASNELKKSEAWSTLKSLVFTSREESLEKQLKSECERATLDQSEIYRLQGRLFEAKKYDLDKLIESYRIELSNIRKTLLN